MSITVVLSQEKTITISREQVSNLNDLKEKIQEEIKIPHDLQLLLNKENLILSEKHFAELLHQNDDLSLTLFVKGTDNVDVHTICNQFNINNDINEVKVRVFTSRQPVLDTIEVSLGSKISDIKSMLEEEYDISKDVCTFYSEDFDETKVFPLEEIDEGMFLIDLFFKEEKLNKEPAVQLMFKYDENDEWKDMPDTLSIPRILLKTFPGDETVLELNGGNIIDTVAVKRKVEEELGIPVELQVLYLDDFEWEESLLAYKFSSYCDLLSEGFFEIKLLVLPTKDPKVIKVCKENKIFLFNPLSVIGANGELFEYSFGLHSTVEDLFSFVSKEVQIPASHQVLICDGQEVGSKNKKIAEIHVQTEEEYSRYSEVNVKNKIDIYLGVKGTLDSAISEVCLNKGIKSLKTVTVFYHDRKTLVEKYSVDDIPSLDELSMKLRSHFGVFPPVLFFKEGYLKNQSLFHWKTSLAAMFFDEERNCFHDNVDVVVCLNMASVLVSDNDIAIVNEFCSKHKVSYLQKVVVHVENQETKELKIREDLDCLGSVKDVAEKLGLSLNGQFISNGERFLKGKRLMEIYFKQADATADSLVFQYKEV